MLRPWQLLILEWQHLVICVPLAETESCKYVDLGVVSLTPRMQLTLINHCCSISFLRYLNWIVKWTKAVKTKTIVCTNILVWIQCLLPFQSLIHAAEQLRLFRIQHKHNQTQHREGFVRNELVQPLKQKEQRIIMSNDHGPLCSDRHGISFISIRASNMKITFFKHI